MVDSTLSLRRPRYPLTRTFKELQQSHDRAVFVGLAPRVVFTHNMTNGLIGTLGRHGLLADIQELMRDLSVWCLVLAQYDTSTQEKQPSAPGFSLIGLFRTILQHRLLTLTSPPRQEHHSNRLEVRLPHRQDRQFSSTCVLGRHYVPHRILARLGYTG